jgi:hypothetical protein
MEERRTFIQAVMIECQKNEMVKFRKRKNVMGIILELRRVFSNPSGF